MVLDTSLLNTQQYKLRIKVKWSNPGKGIAPFPTPQCSSYWKGSPLIALDYSRLLYFYFIKLPVEPIANRLQQFKYSVILHPKVHREEAQGEHPKSEGKEGDRERTGI